MITITDVARKQILLAMQEEERDDLALRVGITGKASSGFQYRMDLVPANERSESDEVVDAGEIQVLIDAQSAADLAGATIDFVRKLSESGFKFENPNSPWSESAATEVQRVIDERINPQIASHGGFVTLLDVKEGTAYISFGGGCQGCGMVDMTLKQGVEAMILESVPAVDKVLDTTDHAAGTNPYYAGPPP